MKIHITIDADTVNITNIYGDVTQDDGFDDPGDPTPMISPEARPMVGKSPFQTLKDLADAAQLPPLPPKPAHMWNGATYMSDPSKPLPAKQPVPAPQPLHAALDAGLFSLLFGDEDTCCAVYMDGKVYHISGCGCAELTKH